MGLRSNERTRARYGEDSSGWDGGPIPYPSTITPVIALSDNRFEDVEPSDTRDITVTVIDGGVPVVGDTIIATSSDPSIVTTSVSGITDGAGQAVVTLTAVADGAAAILIQATNARGKPAVMGVVTPVPVVTLTVLPTSLTVAALAVGTAVLTLQTDGVPNVGDQVAAVSALPGIATVAVPAVTDGSGNTDIVVTGVAAGSANITVTFPNAPTVVIPVVVT